MQIFMRERQTKKISSNVCVGAKSLNSRSFYTQHRTGMTNLTVTQFKHENFQQNSSVLLFHITIALAWAINYRMCAENCNFFYSEYTYLAINHLFNNDNNELCVSMSTSSGHVPFKFSTGLIIFFLNDERFFSSRALCNFYIHNNNNDFFTSFSIFIFEIA